METLSTVATLTIASGVLSLVCLLVLHFISPEFSPGWRMVSEYASGKYKWLLTMFFTLWCVCALLSAYILWHVVTTKWAMFGVVLIALFGIGALMGGLFDVKHKLHGTAFLLGIPTLPIGALLVSYHLIKTGNWSAHQSIVLLSAHAIWVSLVLMAISMMVLFSGFKKAGIPMGPNAEPPKALPAGVIGVNGYANRILVICYIGWLIIIAKTYLAIY